MMAEGKRVYWPFGFRLGSFRSIRWAFNSARILRSALIFSIKVVFTSARIFRVEPVSALTFSLSFSLQLSSRSYSFLLPSVQQMILFSSRISWKTLWQLS